MKIFFSMICGEILWLSALTVGVKSLWLDFKNKQYQWKNSHIFFSFYLICRHSKIIWWAMEYGWYLSTSKILVWRNALVIHGNFTEEKMKQLPCCQWWFFSPATFTLQPHLVDSSHAQTPHFLSEMALACLSILNSTPCVYLSLLFAAIILFFHFSRATHDIFDFILFTLYSIGGCHMQNHL